MSVYRYLFENPTMNRVADLTPPAQWACSTVCEKSSCKRNVFVFEEAKSRIYPWSWIPVQLKEFQAIETKLQEIRVTWINNKSVTTTENLEEENQKC